MIQAQPEITLPTTAPQSDSINSSKTKKPVIVDKIIIRIEAVVRFIFIDACLHIYYIYCSAKKKRILHSVFSVVTSTGFEPVSAAVKGRCVKPLHQLAKCLHIIPWRLSQRKKYFKKRRNIFARTQTKTDPKICFQAGVERIELPSAVLETDVLPLYDTPINNKWRVRDSNPWMPPWKGGVLSRFTNSPCAQI